MATLSSIPSCAGHTHWQEATQAAPPLLVVEVAVSGRQAVYTCHRGKHRATDRLFLHRSQGTWPAAGPAAASVAVRAVGLANPASFLCSAAARPFGHISLCRAKASALGTTLRSPWHSHIEAHHHLSISGLVPWYSCPQLMPQMWLQPRSCSLDCTHPCTVSPRQSMTSS